MAKKRPVLYESIGTFSQKLGVSASTLRYYEQQGLFQARRDHHGRRYYTDEDMEWMAFLLHLKAAGMKIIELKQYVVWRKNGESSVPQRLDLLRNTKSRLVQQLQVLQHHLKILDDKINWYEARQQGMLHVPDVFADYLKQLNHKL
ncbi:MerR family transcriptional regulator [Neisseriaceae bacterium ESL0693]|nr:MerR family transcriptional regulator [Neisseriaceae bacterium ESL0693]